MPGIHPPTACSARSDGHILPAGDVAVATVLGGIGSVDIGSDPAMMASDSTGSRDTLRTSSAPLAVSPPCLLPHTCMASSTVSHAFAHLPCLIHSLAAHLLHVIRLVATLCDKALEHQCQQQQQQQTESDSAVSGALLCQAVSEGTLRVRLLHYHAENEAVAAGKGVSHPKSGAPEEPLERAPEGRAVVGSAVALAGPADGGKMSTGSLTVARMGCPEKPHLHQRPAHENMSHALKDRQQGRGGSNRKKQGGKGKVGGAGSEAGHLSLTGDMAGEELSGARLWQQWHYDYGILTGLVPPLYSPLPTASLALPSGDSARRMDSARENSAAMGRSCTVREHRMPYLADSHAQQQFPISLPSSCKESTLCAGERCLVNPTTSKSSSLHGGAQAETNRVAGDARAGLHVWHHPTGKAICVDVPAGCVAVICGETAQILSGGSLMAPAHCVVRSGEPVTASTRSVRVDHAVREACNTYFNMQNSTLPEQCVSRDMFVVFSMPKRSLLMSPPPCRNRQDVLHGWDADGGLDVVTINESRVVPTSIEKVAPSLSCRWKGNEDFGHFAKSTTSFYYGKRR